MEFKIESYLVRQITENTDRVVFGFILTKVLLSNLKFVRQRRKIESYPV